jgi:hypothetical protein
MKLTDRDKRALVILGVVATIVLIWYFLPDNGKPVVAVSTDSIPATEKRLQRLKQQAATVPGKEQVLAAVSTELAGREKGLIQADSAAQAQAQLLQIIRRIARSETSTVRSPSRSTLKPASNS